jgi:YD repeat-containing protein
MWSTAHAFTGSRRFKGGMTLAVLVLSTLLVSNASGLGVTYTYDQVGRVAAAIYDNGLCVAYTYDAAGNRTSQTNATTSAPTWGSGVWGCFNWTP